MSLGRLARALDDLLGLGPGLLEALAVFAQQFVGLLAGALGGVDRLRDAFATIVGNEIAQDHVEILQKTFEEIEGYDEMIVLRGIRFESHCEHHMAPIIGQAWVGYVPSGRVVGVSKLARVVEVYAKRLQIQEKMTAQIANTINDVLKPQGVGVIIKASHHCMTTRGIHKPDSDLVTSRMLGCFRENPLTRQEFLSMAA